MASKDKMNANFQMIKVLEDPILVHIVTNIRQQQEPMCRLAALYILNSLLSKSLVPRRVAFCISEGLVTTLMEILNKSFDRKDPSNDAQLYTVAAEIIWRLTSLGVQEHGLLLTDAVVRGLVEFVSLRSKYYQFSPGLAEKLQRLSEGRYFPSQKVTHLKATTELLDDLAVYSHDVGKYSQIHQMYACKLSLDLEDDPQPLFLADLFVREGYAWPRCKTQQCSSPLPPSPKHQSHTPPSTNQSDKSPSTSSSHAAPRVAPELSSPGKNAPVVQEHSPGGCSTNSSTSSNIEVDVDVTDVKFVCPIGGNYFWGIIGADSIKSTYSVSQLLTMAAPDLQIVAPKMGEIVAVMLEEEPHPGCPTVIRGKLVDVQDEWVMVQSLDFGFTKIVKDSQIFGLTGTASYLTKFPPQGQICFLAGIQAPPVDDAAIELVLAALAQLTRQSSAASTLLVKVGALDALVSLVQCGHLTIQLQVTRTVSNMAAVAKLNKQADFSVFIRPLLSILQGMTKYDLTHQQRNMVVACLSALSNITFFCREHRKVFFNHQGQMVVLGLLERFGRVTPIIHTSAKLLQTCYPGLLSSRESDDQSHGYAREDEQPDDDADEIVDDLKQGESSICLPEADESSDDDENVRLLEKKLQGEMIFDSDDDNEGSHGLQETSGSEASCKRDSEASCEEMVSSHESDSASSTVHGEDAVLPVDGGSLTAVDQFDTLKIDTYMGFVDDETHHICEERRLSRISAARLAQIICGMVNSGQGGSVYLGLSKEGKVQGLKLSRDERDEMRLGIDQMMTTKFIPPLFHNQLDIVYKPVVTCQENGQLMAYVDLFVVEIMVKSVSHTVYSLNEGGICWYRFGPHTTKLSLQDVRELVALDEEEKYKEDILRLREDLQRLKLETTDS